MFELIFIASLVVLVYVYFIYPAMLIASQRMVLAVEGFQAKGKIPYLDDPKSNTSKQRLRDALPSVTMVVPCRNEAQNLDAKIRNFMALKYPPEKLKLILVDDASDDESAARLSHLRSTRIKVIRNEVRLGKTASLIKAGNTAATGVLVFSDCAAILNPTAVFALVRRFRDVSVGLVTGAYSAVPPSASTRSSGEGLYWKYEIGIRNLESRIQSTTHATGALYAIRTHLFKNMVWKPGVINDDLYIPLKVLETGYNIKSEKRARAREYVHSTVGGEFARRSRIASGNFQMIPEAFNLVRAGRYFPLFQLFSHKWLRNAGGFLLPFLLISNMILAWDSPFYLWLLVGQFFFYLLAGAGLLKNAAPAFKRAAILPFYFVSTNLASVYGAWRILTHKGNVVWEKTDMTVAELEHVR